MSSAFLEKCAGSIACPQKGHDLSCNHILRIFLHPTSSPAVFSRNSSACFRRAIISREISASVLSEGFFFSPRAVIFLSKFAISASAFLTAVSNNFASEIECSRPPERFGYFGYFSANLF